MDNNSDGSIPDDKRFVSHPDAERHEQFMRQVMEIVLKEAVFDGTSRQGLVVEWMEPDALAEVLGTNLSLPDQPQPHHKLVNLLKSVIRYSVKTGHPRFINQLFSR